MRLHFYSCVVTSSVALHDIHLWNNYPISQNFLRAFLFFIQNAHKAVFSLVLPLFEFCKGRLNIKVQIRIRELIAIASRIRTFINILHRAVYTESVYLQGMDFIQKTRIRILQRITCVAIGVIRPQ